VARTVRAAWLRMRPPRSTPPALEAASTFATALCKASAAIDDYADDAQLAAASPLAQQSARENARQLLEALEDALGGLLALFGEGAANDAASAALTALERNFETVDELRQGSEWSRSEAGRGDALEEARTHSASAVDAYAAAAASALDGAAGAVAASATEAGAGPPASPGTRSRVGRPRTPRADA
jgi:hypothetical protein